MSKELANRYVRNGGGVVTEVTADQFMVIGTQYGIVEISESDYKAALKEAARNPVADLAAAVATSTDERFKSLEQKALAYEGRLAKLEIAQKQGPMTPPPVDPTEIPSENTVVGTVLTSTTPEIKGGLGENSDTNRRDGGPVRNR